MDEKSAGDSGKFDSCVNRSVLSSELHSVVSWCVVLQGRLDSSVPRSKRLLTDDRSNILIYMTGVCVCVCVWCVCVHAGTYACV